MPAELFSVEQVERARRYHRPLYIALLLDETLGLATLSVLAFTRVGSLLYDAVPGAAFPALIVAVSAMVRLPLAFWRGLLRERRWGFSTQSVRGWLLDRMKGLGVSAVLTSVALLRLAGVARWLPRTWPLVGAMTRARIFSRVDFPAPLPPTTPSTVPGSTSKDTSCRAQSSFELRSSSASGMALRICSCARL